MSVDQGLTNSNSLTNNPARPTCINPGCKKKVTNDGIRYRPVCSHCYKAGRGVNDYAPGVTSYRTGICSNIDGHIENAPCPIDWEKMKKHGNQIHTHLDHKDGNHWNNVPKNVEELCPICHNTKSKANGDKSGHRY